MKQIKSEYTASLAMAQAKIFPNKGWTVGVNFAKPLARKENKKSFLKMLKSVL